MIIELQPISVLIGLAITGLFTGIGVAIGGVIVKVWIEPRVAKWQESHKKIAEQIIKKPDLKESVIFRKRVVQEIPKPKPKRKTRKKRK
jgi:hypothetical protein